MIRQYIYNKNKTEIITRTQYYKAGTDRRKNMSPVTGSLFKRNLKKKIKKE